MKKTGKGVIQQIEENPVEVGSEFNIKDIEKAIEIAGERTEKE